MRKLLLGLNRISVNWDIKFVSLSLWMCVRTPEISVSTAYTFSILRMFWGFSTELLDCYTTAVVVDEEVSWRLLLLVLMLCELHKSIIVVLLHAKSS